MPRHSLRYPGDQALVVDLARHRPKHIWQDIQCTIDKVGIIWNGYSVCLTRWALYGVIWMMGNIIDGQVGANCEGAWHNKWGGYYIEYMAGIILNCNNEFFFFISSSFQLPVSLDICLQFLFPPQWLSLAPHWQQGPGEESRRLLHRDALLNLDWWEEGPHLQIERHLQRTHTVFSEGVSSSCLLAMMDPGGSRKVHGTHPFQSKN